MDSKILQAGHQASASKRPGRTHYLVSLTDKGLWQQCYLVSLTDKWLWQPRYLASLTDKRCWQPHYIVSLTDEWLWQLCYLASLTDKRCLQWVPRKWGKICYFPFCMHVYEKTWPFNGQQIAHVTSSHPSNKNVHLDKKKFSRLLAAVTEPRQNAKVLRMQRTNSSGLKKYLQKVNNFFIYGHCLKLPPPPPPIVFFFSTRTYSM